MKPFWIFVGVFGRDLQLFSFFCHYNIKFFLSKLSNFYVLLAIYNYCYRFISLFRVFS